MSCILDHTGFRLSPIKFSLHLSAHWVPNSYSTIKDVGIIRIKLLISFPNSAQPIGNGFGLVINERNCKTLQKIRKNFLNLQPETPQKKKKIIYSPVTKKYGDLLLDYIR